MALFDASERVLDANEALCGLLGYRLADLNNMPAAGLLHPDDRGASLFVDAAALDAPLNQSRVHQRVLVRSDGQTVHCDVHSAASVARSPPGATCPMWTDVTGVGKMGRRCRPRSRGAATGPASRQRRSHRRKPLPSQRSRRSLSESCST
ncbi:PAS domain S-box protein [Saccharopolyspora sp. NPDC002686]|uniref:PAS domain S-box protein n=1 Tax=Saccharopolyspora sp. NPDC002686 TaxID=3154541 RepID=UPI0033169A8C